MGTTNIYRVILHYEQGGKRCGHDEIYHVAAAASDYNTIKTVLSNNSLLKGGNYTLVIDAVHSEPSGSNTVYS